MRALCCVRAPSFESARRNDFFSPSKYLFFISFLSQGLRGLYRGSRIINDSFCNIPRFCKTTGYKYDQLLPIPKGVMLSGMSCNCEFEAAIPKRRSLGFLLSPAFPASNYREARKVCRTSPSEGSSALSFILHYVVTE